MPLSDFHIGDPAGLGGSSEEGKFATKKFRNMVQWIKDTPEAYTFLVGDIFDVAIKNSVGNVYQQCFNLKEAKDFAYEELKPIQDRILGIVSGNHEERMERETGDNPACELSYRLDIEYFPDWCAYLFLGVGEGYGKKDRRRPIFYSVFLHHMTGGGRTKGGKLNRVAILKDMCLADVYLGAHVHLKGAFEGKYVYPDFNCHKLREQKQTYVATGSYMGYANYSIKAQYDKPATGAVRIRMSGTPEKGKDIHASI